MNLFFALMLFLPSPSQKHQTLTKLYINRTTAKLERIISDRDTSYAFQFISAKAWSLSRKKIIPFSKDELHQFSNDLIASETAASQTTIDEKTYSISKTKVFGSWGETVYRIDYNNGLCKLNKRQLKRLISAIGKEI